MLKLLNNNKQISRQPAQKFCSNFIYIKSNSMKLFELIETSNWLSVKLTLLCLYPDEEKNIESYNRVYEMLLQTTHVESELRIVLKTCFEKDEDDYVQVYGIKTFKKADEKSISYAIEFRNWNEWLGMEISTSTLKEFNELEIISHCLFEMTFCGFDEEVIQTQCKEIEKDFEDFKNMTPEERKQHTTSLEDLMKELGDDEA